METFQILMQSVELLLLLPEAAAELAAQEELVAQEEAGEGMAQAELVAQEALLEQYLPGGRSVTSHLAMFFLIQYIPPIM